MEGGYKMLYTRQWGGGKAGQGIHHQQVRGILCSQSPSKISYSFVYSCLNI
jgi:hypothetical protein